MDPIFEFYLYEADNGNFGFANHIRHQYSCIATKKICFSDYTFITCGILLECVDHATTRIYRKLEHSVFLLLIISEYVGNFGTHRQPVDVIQEHE